MYQTQIFGTSCKFSLQWEQTKDYSGSHTYNGNLFDRLNFLYNNINKLTFEFVECAQQLEISHKDEDYPALEFQIESVIEKPINVKSSSNVHQERLVDDACSETEISSDKKTSCEVDVDKNDPVEEIKRLKNNIEHLESELKEKILNYETEISNLQCQHEQNIKHLKTRHEDEMSDLRVYFEKSFSDNLKQFTDVTDVHDHESNIELYSNSDNECAEPNYKVNERFIELESDTDNENEGGGVDHNIVQRKDFKNCMLKTINTEMDKFQTLARVKDEEIQRLKKENDELQYEVDRLQQHQELTNKVQELLADVRKSYESYLDELNESVDTSFLQGLKNDKIDLEEKLKHKFQLQLNELDVQSEMEIEKLSGTLVGLVLKSVCFEEHVKKLNEENKNLLNQMNKQKVEFEQRNFEIKKMFVDKLELSTSYENENSLDIIIKQITNMKKLHSELKAENVKLKQVVDQLENQIVSNGREILLENACKEIDDLIKKEKIGECVTWPSELIALERVFSRRNEGDVLEKTKSVETCVEENGISSTVKMDELLEERNGLKKINFALRGVIQMFTAHLANHQDELNNSIVGALVKAEQLNNQITRLSLNETTVADADQKDLDVSAINLEVLSLLESSDILDVSDKSISICDEDLKRWLDILRTEASSVLQLISEKVDNNEKNKVVTNTAFTQTDMKIEDINFLHEKIINSNVEMSKLSEKVISLQSKILNSECIEAYGEGPASLTSMPKLSDINSKNCSSCEEEVLEIIDENDKQESEEFCVNCDKIKDHAKKVIEDLQSQIVVLEQRRKSNDEFLEKQTAERECERDESDKKIQTLLAQVKANEKATNKNNKLENEVLNLEQNVKELTEELDRCQESNVALESRVKTFDNKVRQLREVIHDLEEKLAGKSELADQLEAKLKDKEAELQDLETVHQQLIQQFDSWSEGNIHHMEEFNEKHAHSSAAIEDMKTEIMEIEKIVGVRTKELENGCLSGLSLSSYSSPCEDLSVNDRLKLTSPCGSDVSSSPIRAPPCFNLMACFHEKIKKLFRAEDIALKKLKDQELEIEKQIELISHLKLERDTAVQSSHSVSENMTRLKIKLENLQHQQNSLESDVQSSLKEKVTSLERQIAEHKKSLSQKENKLLEQNKIVEEQREYISKSEREFRGELDRLLEENKALQRFYSSASSSLLPEQGSANSITITSNTSTITGGSATNEFSTNSSSSTAVAATKLSSPPQFQSGSITMLSPPVAESSGANGNGNRSQSPDSSPKHNRVSFCETLETYHIDPNDVTRRGPDNIYSHLSPIYEASVVDEVYEPSNASRLSIRRRVGLPLQKTIEESEEYSLDAFSSTNNSHHLNTAEGVTSKSSDPENDIDAVRQLLVREEVNHSSTKTQMEELERRLHDHETLAKEIEVRLQKESKVAKNEVIKVREELAVYKKQCQEYEEQILSLSETLKLNNRMIDELSAKLNAINANGVDGAGRANDDANFGGSYTVESELKDELRNVQKQLENERSKVSQQNEVIKSLKEENSIMRDAIIRLDMMYDRLVNELENERKKVSQLLSSNRDLKTQLAAFLKERDEKWKGSDEIYKYEPIANASPSRRASLRDLTNKVQKEVAIATELDENMLKSLESNSKTCPNLSDKLKGILFKILREGCDALNFEDSSQLVQSLKLFSPYVLQLQQKENEIASLQDELKSDKSTIAFLRTEVSRIGELQSYCDERLSYYVAKLEEYRNRYTKSELEMTRQSCNYKQLQMQKSKEMEDVRDICQKQINEFVEQNNNIANENMALKSEINKIKQSNDTLTAELNSKKSVFNAIVTDGSETNTRVQQFIGPIKKKLAMEREHTNRLKNECDKLSNELLIVKSNLKIEQAGRKKTETMYQAALVEKYTAVKEVTDVQLEIKNLQLEKKRIEDKLKAAEMIEVKRRRNFANKEASDKEQYNSLVESYKNLEKNNSILKRKIEKIQEQYESLHYAWRRVSEEYQVIFNRCLHAESFRRNLVFQKNYIIIRCLEVSTSSDQRRAALIHTNSTIIKFKRIAVFLIALNRMKNKALKRRNGYSMLLSQHLNSKLRNVKVYPYDNYPNYYEILDAEDDNISVSSRNEFPSLEIPRYTLNGNNNNNNNRHRDDENEPGPLLLIDNTLKTTYFDFINMKKRYLPCDD